jgi:hypothetical protein
MFSRNAALLPGARLVGPVERRPWWLLPLLLLAVAGLLAGGSTAVDALHPDKRLEQYALAGERGPDCQRVVVGSDLSGSMRAYATARDAASAQLDSWAPGQLRPDDELGEVAFAAEALPWRVATAIGRGLPPRAGAVPADGVDTNLRPLLDAVAAMPPSACPLTVVLVSDGQLADLPADAAAGRELLRTEHAHRIVLAVPARAITVPDAWRRAFPDAEPLRFDGTDPDQTALTLGRIVADVVGQHLVSR